MPGKKTRNRLRLTVTAALLVICGGLAERPEHAAERKLAWVTGYWYSPPVWGGLPVADIDYSALTHIVHRGLRPLRDGSFDPMSLKYLTDYAPDLIGTAHRKGVKVLVSVAQQAPDDELRSASSTSALNRLVSNVMTLVRTYGYDGVDIDWENNVEPRGFGRLVAAVRGQLDEMHPRGVMTGAFWEPAAYLVDHQKLLDQINVMTYDLCSPGDGASWYNAAVHDPRGEGRRTVDWRLGQFAAVLDTPRLGLGIPFYGYVWTGSITKAGETWRTPPTMRPIDYRHLVTDRRRWHAENLHRDAEAGDVPWLSLPPLGSTPGEFITYDDEISVARKVEYAQSHGLGGVMIWELSADYFPDRTPKHPLMRAVKGAVDRF
jgi:chitinase